MECSKKERIRIKLLSLVVAVALISLLIGILQYPVFGIYKQMMIGAFGSLYSIRYVLVKTVPLALCAIGVTYAYRMKFWNIGAEGQVMMGAFAATGIALFYNQLPKPLVLLLMALAAIFMGAVWILLPAIFKIKLGVNETILTLMLNYVAHSGSLICSTADGRILRHLVLPRSPPLKIPLHFQNCSEYILDFTLCC